MKNDRDRNPIANPIEIPQVGNSQEWYMEKISTNEQKWLCCRLFKQALKPTQISWYLLIPLEDQALAHALKMMDNNVTQAAQALKMAQSTLYRKVKLYQLAGPD